MQHEKIHLNLLTLGNYQSGLSTLAGLLIYKLGEIEKSRIQQLETIYQNIGNEKLSYAWFLNSIRGEKEKNNPIFSNNWRFETNKFLYTLLHCQGWSHKLTNMIKGAAKADIGLLILSSDQAFYNCHDSIKSQCLIAYSLGLRQLICCINKMDEQGINYSQDSYNLIVMNMKIHLKKIGFNTDQLYFIPTSGKNEDNIFQQSLKTPWYKGPTLLEALDSVIVPKRHNDRPLRVTINNVYKLKKVGTVVVGKVETGTLQSGEVLKLCPSNIETQIDQIKMHDKELIFAQSGDFISFIAKGVYAKQIKIGDVCSEMKQESAVSAISFMTQVIIIHHPTKIQVGYTPILYCHSTQVACRFDKLIKKIDPFTNKVIDENPLFLKQGDAAFVKLVPLKPVCVEAFSDYPSMSRIIMRDSEQILIIGLIIMVEKKQIQL